MVFANTDEPVNAFSKVGVTAVHVDGSLRGDNDHDEIFTVRPPGKHNSTWGFITTAEPSSKKAGEFDDFFAAGSSFNIPREAFLGEALELINEHDLGVRLWVANGIRLAHVYQWMGAFDIAEEMFFNIVEMCEEKKEVSEYFNFALQHFGKFYFDLGEYEEALEYFEEAMELRKTIGDDSLIKSTQFAIDVTKKHIKEDNVINFPKNDFEGDNLKAARDSLELVKERASGNEFLTLYDLNQELSQVAYNQNNMPKSSISWLESSSDARYSV